MADKEMVAATLAAAVYTRITTPPPVRDNGISAMMQIRGPTDPDEQAEKIVEIYKKVLARLDE